MIAHAAANDELVIFWFSYLHRYAEVIVVALEAAVMLLLVLYFQNSFLHRMNVAAGTTLLIVAVVFKVSPETMQAMLPLMIIYATASTMFR